MYNVIDVERFKKDFYESIAPIFKEYIESTFLQKSIYKGHILNLRNGKCKSNGGLNSPFLRIIKNKMGSLSAKGGLYFEKRLKIVDSILIDNLNLDTFACIKQGDKVFRKKFVVPKGTDSLIVKYSKKLWRKEANFENFEYYLKNIFDYMLEHCGEEEVVVHDIDQILMTKTGKIFVLELKTKQRAQDFNAYMDVAKLIETWACLTYQLIKDNIDMVDFRNSDISNVKNLVCSCCNSIAQDLINNYGKNALEKYWDYDKNKNLDPFKIQRCSHKKVWIKCQENEEHGSYDITCANFTSNGNRCPICNEWHGERKIREYLTKNNIEFTAQKTFSNLLGTGEKRNKPLSYDFYIPVNNLLIEFQGEQHYMPVDFSGKGMKQAEKDFEKQQEHDRRKREYAQQNNIDLLEITYLEENKIEEILDKIFK